MKFPLSSTGFVLDGFPRYPDEVQFLGEHGFFPDAAVFIQVDDQDIFDRLLPAQISKWKVKQKKKLERKKQIKEMKAKIKVGIHFKKHFKEFLLWCNGIGGVLGALGRRFHPKPGTEG